MTDSGGVCYIEIECCDFFFFFLNLLFYVVYDLSASVEKGFVVFRRDMVNGMTEDVEQFRLLIGKE